jgi:hypothetical protein
MARIQTFHPDEPTNAKLVEAGYKNGQAVHERDVMEVVHKLFYTTILNIMIQHQGTENTIIWVDLGKFRQR